jgi:pimeloyl-ACP methyl ester carboxylesterase
VTSEAARVTFSEGFVDADGFRIRYREGGQGAPLVYLHGAGSPRPNPAHALLARRFRVIAFEMPGFGESPENTRTRTMGELASTMIEAITKLGIDTFNLIGRSFGGTTALWMALQAPARVRALVLEAPGAFRPEGARMPSNHPLVVRLRGPARDAELERRVRGLTTPTLVLFGTRDDVIAPSMGRVYKELLPNGHLVFVYDAGHAISTDRPEAYTDVVADFLERHEAFVVNRERTVIHP